MKNKIYPIAPLFFTAFLGNLHGDEMQTANYGGAFFFEVDALYGKLKQAGLEQLPITSKAESVVTVDTGTQQIEITDRTTRLHRPSFDWRWGFRLGAGYYFKDCTWALSALWTHLDGFAHGNSSEGSLHTKIRWKLNYNVLDLVLTGPEFRLGTSFSWHPFAGVKSAKINQRIHATSGFSTRRENLFSTTNFDVSHSVSRHKERLSFVGIGPEAGVKMAWALTNCWSFYANADGAFLYSYFKSKATDPSRTDILQLSPVNPLAEIQFISDETTFHNANKCQPVLDIGLGIRWQQYDCLREHNTGWTVKLGWDHTQWFDYSFLGIAGDLWLDTLTLSAELQF